LQRDPDEAAAVVELASASGYVLVPHDAGPAEDLDLWFGQLLDALGNLGPDNRGISGSATNDGRWDGQALGYKVSRCSGRELRVAARPAPPRTRRRRRFQSAR
jgi:glycerate kinase